MIRVLHLVTYPIVFNFHYDQGRQGRVFKRMKNDQLFFYLLFFRSVFLAVWFLFPMFLGRSRKALY